MVAARERERTLNYFVTSETTFDVSHAELLVLQDLAEALTRVSSDLEIEGVEFVGIVIVIMNPAIAPPFPAGVVFRRGRKELDIKPTVDFAKWKAADRNDRITLVIEAVAEVLSSKARRTVPEHDRLALAEALRRARHALLH